MSTGTLVVFHLGGQGGPARSVFPAMSMLAEHGGVETVVPEPGPVAETYSRLGRVLVADYGTLTYARRPREAASLVRALARDTRTFRRLFRERRPDRVVVVTTVLPAALIAARLERITVLVYAAEVYRQEWKRSRGLHVWGALLSWFVARTADAIVCCSGLVAAQFDSRVAVVVAHPPIDQSYGEGDRERGRARYGLEGADPCLAVVGALSRGRGQDVALRALAIVRERLPGARLLLVGAPHPRTADLAFADELRELARDLGVADSVVFAGATDEVADVYAATDVVLNPARVAEGFGRVVAEALVARRPVVASRVGVLDEVIRPGVDGLLVPPDDPRSLAEAVVRVTEDDGLRTRLVSSGHERVLERFSVGESLGAWRTVLRGTPPR